jgi:hypothetical protein
MPLPTRAALPLLLLAASLSAACESSALSCPSGSVSVGTFPVAFGEVQKTDRCLVTASDAGAVGTALLGTPNATSVTVCAAPGSPATVYVGFSSAGFRSGPLDGGSYAITDTGTLANGATLCSCAIDVQEVISGSLSAADGGPIGFGFAADGGFSPVASAKGSFDYSVSRSASAAGACNCNVPCGAHFTFQ